MMGIKFTRHCIKRLQIRKDRWTSAQLHRHMVY
jgi:hypothetical protein